MLLILVKIIFFKIFEVEILAPGGWICYMWGEGERCWVIRPPASLK